MVKATISLILPSIPEHPPLQVSYKNAENRNVSMNDIHMYVILYVEKRSHLEDIS